MSDKQNITIFSYNQNAKGYAYYYYNKNIMHKNIDEFLSLISKSNNILDAGCGPGHDSYYIKSKGYKVIGIDLSCEMIKEAKIRGKGITFLKKDILQDWPSKYHFFSGIWCCAVLVHLNSIEINIAIANFNKVLKNNGILFISLLHGHGNSIKTENRPYGVMTRYFNYYRVNELENILTNNKFKVLKINKNGIWIPCIAQKCDN